MPHKFHLRIILFLAFLQCLAPLLHAHPFGVSIAKGVHLHWGLDYEADATDEQVASQGYAPSMAECPAIGMEKPLKPDCLDCSIPPVAASLFVFVASLVRSFGMADKERRRSSLSHILPPSQAPPASF